MKKTLYNESVDLIILVAGTQDIDEMLGNIPLYKWMLTHNIRTDIAEANLRKLVVEHKSIEAAKAIVSASKKEGDKDLDLFTGVDADGD